MSDVTYIFDYGTLGLYDIFSKISISENLKSVYPIFVRCFTHRGNDQYNFWLSLPQSQKDAIRNEINNQRRAVLANIQLYDGKYQLYSVGYLDMPDLIELLKQNKIIAHKVVSEEYMQFTDINGNNYLVYGRYDQKSNKIFPHK